MARGRNFWLLGRGLSAAAASPRVRSLVGLTGLIVALASSVYVWLEGWGWIDAFYFSVITIATVGYGDLAPKTDTGKLFTIAFILVGIGMFVATASAVADAIIDSADPDQHPDNQD